jgi:hypothetical protein
MATYISRSSWAGLSLCVLGAIASIALITIVTYVGLGRFGPHPFPTVIGPSLITRVAFLLVYAPACIVVGIAVTRYKHSARMVGLGLAVLSIEVYPHSVPWMGAGVFVLLLACWRERSEI